LPSSTELLPIQATGVYGDNDFSDRVPNSFNHTIQRARIVAMGPQQDRALGSGVVMKPGVEKYAIIFLI
jgi:hypothetical protein